ncbi:unnamed protein product [Urochloa humidicola]
MGNVCSGIGASVDEENDLAGSLADAAATGAREGLIKAFQAQRQGQQSPSQGALIGDMLTVKFAQEAAADGVEQALEAMSKELNFARRFACCIRQVKRSAKHGARAGLQELERKVMKSDIELDGAVKVIDLEVAAAAAATGARAACFIAAQKNLNPNRYTIFLGPMLGGSFPSSAAVYNFIGGKSDVVKLCGFGGFTLAVFVISSGLAAGLLGRSAKSAGYTRFAALAAVTIVLALFTFGLCSLFTSPWYKGVCGIIFAILITILVLIWLIFEW